MELELRSELAVRGLASAPPIRRTAGAGPSDDGHWRLADGSGCGAAAVPLNPRSPFSVDAEGRLARDGVVIEDTMVEPIDRPRFYDLRTAEGIAYEQIARMHGDGVLASTVVQTCIRYDREETRCRFCTIEASLSAGATTQVKRPEELAEVALAAVELDGAHQMVLTTGTSNGRDRGAKHLARVVAAVKAVLPDLPIQVQIEPPLDLEWIDALHAAGAEAIGIHIETLDPIARVQWTPGKATVPLSRYEEAWRHAVTVFGTNHVSTYLLVGLGEDPDDLVEGARRLIAMGVYPFVVPYRPLVGSLAFGDGVPAPDVATVTQVTRRVAAELALAGMRGADQQAGCAACGACSALQHAGG